MKSKAIIFVLKYENEYTKCSMKRNILSSRHELFANFDVVKIYSDDVTYAKVTKTSITNSMYKLALDSHRFKLDDVFVYFKCYGCMNNNTNNDFYFYPIDYKASGAIEIHIIKEIFKQFYFGTNTVCVFDYYDRTLKQHFTYDLF